MIKLTWNSKVKAKKQRIKELDSQIKTKIGQIDKANVVLDDKEKEGIPLKLYNKAYGDKKASKKYWVNYVKDRYLADRTVLVNIELLNGSHRSFLAVEKDGGFKYKKKLYLFDNESKYYNIDCKLWAYDYHENFTLPIKRKIPLTDIKKAVEFSKITDIEYATNPATLQRFVTAKIAEGIMKGQQIDEWLKQIKLVLILVTITSVVHLILFMFKTGMLSQLKVPFG